MPHGNIHPHDRKAATKNQPVTVPELAPAFVVLPMLMHAGAPCSPTVAVGDHVLRGQKIAQPVGLGAPIHSPVSGTVTAVEPRPHPDGTCVPAVVIENDFRDTPAPSLTRKAEAENLTCWEAADLVTEAGVVGLGGAGYPTGVILKNSIGKVDTLIINGAECEPYVTADHRLMLEDGARILSGTGILMRTLGAKTVLIAIQSNKMDAIRNLRSLLSDNSAVQIVTLRTRYPVGSEAQLIRKLTGRRLPPGKLPLDVKCAVFNVATAAAVSDAVLHGLPLTHRIVTVSGGCVSEPRNLLVPIGTPLSHLAEECGGLDCEPDRVLVGGPMMGIAQPNLEAPVIKTTNALLFLHRRECAPAPAEPSCIRCGRCMKACPAGLTPLYFDLYARKGRFAELEKLRVMDCAECGSCAYICPAHIPLVQSIRTAKDAIRRPARPEENRAAAGREEESQ